MAGTEAGGGDVGSGGGGGRAPSGTIVGVALTMCASSQWVLQIHSWDYDV